MQKRRKNKVFFEKIETKLIKDSVLCEESTIYKKRCSSSEKAYQVLQPLLKNAPHEEFYAIHLNSKAQVIGYCLVSIGTLNNTLVHPREVFKAAIVNNACSVIVAHNHPSGCIEPSREDILITKRLVKSGEILGIAVVDHIIIGENSYISFAESGYLR